MLHWVAWLVARILYRLRIVGQENLLNSGGLLLVSNHVSYADWLVIMGATPRRVRFVVAANFFRKPFVGWVLRRVGAIPMDRNPGAHSLKHTFSTVEDALRAGEVVCVFPEGYPTRNGVMLPFRRGFEKILRDLPVPVIPVYLDQLWGSIFSYQGGRLFWKWPMRGKYPVTVAFGKQLPSDVTAPQVRQTLQVLSADLAKQRTATILPVHRQFVRSAARHPFRACLIDTSGAQPIPISRGKVMAGGWCLSRWLRPILGSHEMVGVWLPQSTAAVLANLALTLLHKTAVNLNYTAGTESLHSAARQCKIRHVLTSKRFTSRVPLELGPDVVLVYLEDAREQISSARKLSAFLWTVLLPGRLLDRILGLGRHCAADLATVVFSSGSTGEPKGVMLTHQNIAANVEAFIGFVDFTKRDHVLGILPFFHSFGYTVTLWGALMAGAQTVYHPDPRAAKEVGELCRKYGCTLMAGTATFLRLYMRRCQPDDFKTMRLLVCGAEKLPPALIEEFHSKFGVMPLEGYGCTELSPVVSVNIPDVTVNNLKQIGTKVGSIGHTLPGVAGKIIDAESGQPLGFGHEGLLLITGPNVMRGYLGREDLTSKKIHDGWYDTGDVGRIDEDGFITLTGRLARIAKIAGEMVPLELLEEHIHSILGTGDRVMAIVALPDKKRGERLFVLHLPNPGLDLDATFKKLSERGVPNLWIPDVRDCFEVPEFPVLGSGKLDLRKLRALAEERVSASERV